MLLGMTVGFVVPESLAYMPRANPVSVVVVSSSQYLRSKV
jgi:hypothetical protein